MNSIIETMKDEAAVDGYLKTLIDDFSFTKVDDYLIRSSSGKLEINKMYYHLSRMFITGDIDLYQRMYRKLLC